MLDVDLHPLNSRRTSVAQWFYQVIGEPEVRLRVRLRGNNLHILCESPHRLQATMVVPRLVKALQSKPENLSRLSRAYEHPIDTVILYSRVLGQERPDWVEPIVLKELKSRSPDSPSHDSAATIPDVIPISHKELARAGQADAIASYLSESLSHLGVSVRVHIQKLVPSVKSTTIDPSATISQRLWVICYCNYSPDPSLLAEPIAQQLRDLALEGFQEAVIRSQVSGEETADWALRVDLTPPTQMLEDWARWGDPQAIARLLNESIAQGIQVRVVQQEKTLHIFCSLAAATAKTAPVQSTTLSAIVNELTAIAPQGLETATIYGIKGSDANVYEFDSPDFLNFEDTVAWIQRINLPAASNPALAVSPTTLATQGNQQALTFLLQRLLNPDLEWRLATGGIRIKLCRQQGLLHIMCEAIVCPSQSDVVEAIDPLVRELGISDIAGVRFYGRRSGQSSPLWSYGIDFVNRKRLVPEATPTFIASDAYLDHETEEEDETIADEEGEATASFSDVVKGLGQTLEDVLCATRLVVRSSAMTTAKPTLSRSDVQTRFSAYHGLKVGLIWGTLGLLLTVQVDWLIGLVLRLNSYAIPQASVIAEPMPESLAEPEEVTLPQISLQKATKGTESFNSSGFTKGGSTEIIAEEGDRRSGNVAATLAMARSSNPTFNNQLLDQKLALYQQRLEKRGVPDVIVIGSSRAMRGVDPVVLETALAQQGYNSVEVFNFGINGATSQVVDLMLRRILTPDQLPKLIIWADGARAFNSDRQDLTYEAIASSPGFQQLSAGTFPRNTSTSNASNRSALNPDEMNADSLDRWLNQILGKVSSTYPQRNQLKTALRDQWVNWFSLPSPSNSHVTEAELDLGEGIDLDGFLPISQRFDPQRYYQKYAKVPGAYDGDYQNFQLYGQQHTALVNLLTFLQQHNVELVFVNTPLTDEYLDATRRQYEEEFKAYLNQMRLEHNLITRDLAEAWITEYDFFSDPSHLNRYGAYQVSIQLAQDSMIPWSSAAKQ